MPQFKMIAFIHSGVCGFGRFGVTKSQTPLKRLSVGGIPWSSWHQLGSLKAGIWGPLIPP